MADPAAWPDIAHMGRTELEGEVAALRHTLNAQRDELAKVRNYQRELADRCARKDLELDEWRTGGPGADQPALPDTGR